MDWGSILPVIYQVKPKEVSPQIRVIVHWLEVEALAPATLVQYRVVLRRMRGWRNRECYEAVCAFDWTARMYW